MRSRSVVAGYVSAVVLAVVFAFLFVRALEVRGPVWNGGQQMRVSEVTTATTPAAELYAQLTAYAQERHVDVVRFVPDGEKPDSVRHFFVADGGGEGATWLRDGYDDADPALTTTIAPLSELGSLDPRGYYLVGGSREDALAVLDIIQAAGWTGGVYPYPVGTDLTTYTDFGDLVRAFGVSLLAVLVLVGAGTVLRGTAHGIQRLAGRSSFGILVREVGALLLPVGLLSTAALALLCAGITFYNGFAHASTLLALTGRLGALLLLAAVGAHVVGVVLTNGRDLVDQVKGEIDGRWALIGAYAVRLPAIFVLLSIVAALGQSVYLAQVEAQTRAYWDDAGDAVTLAISGSRSEDEMTAARTGVGELTRDLDNHRSAVLVQGDALAPDYPDALVVNEEYLQQIEVRDAAGNCITATDPNSITILLPNSATATQSARARAATADWYRFQHELTLSDVPDPDEVPIAQTRIQDDQRLFTFRTGSGTVLNGPAISENATLIVLPSLRLIPLSELFAAVSTGDIVFTDPAATTAAVHERGLDSAIAAIQPVAYQANESYREALGSVTVNIASLLAAIIVVALTALIVAIVTVEKNHQRLFVQHLSGWSFIGAHRAALLLEGALVAGIALVSLIAAWNRDPLSVQTVIDLGTISTQDYLVNQSLIALGVSGGAAALLIASLAIAAQRMIRRHSADT